MKFFTADTHFGDERLFLFPRDYKNADLMEADLIRNWNKVITNEDEVYHLGDFLVDESKFDLVSQLNGVKHLIVGNYDEPYDTQRFLDAGFASVSTSLIMDIGELRVNLVHYPTKGVVNRFNIVGHVHGAWRVQKNMLNVGVDAWNYRPVTEKEVLFMYNAIENFYDDDIWAYKHRSNMEHKHRGKAGGAAKGSLKEGSLRSLIK